MQTAHMMSVADTAKWINKTNQILISNLVILRPYLLQIEAKYWKRRNLNQLTMLQDSGLIA